MKRRLTILTALLCLTLTATAQLEQVDSLLGSFEQKPTAQTANVFFRYLNAVGIIDEPIELKSDAPADTLRMQTWYWAAELYHAAQLYERAAEYGVKALPLCRRGKNLEMEGDCLALLSVCYVRVGDFKSAATYAHQCNELDLRQGDPDNISSSYNTLAGIYMSNNQLDEAERYILKAIDYAKRAQNPHRQAVIYGMASEVYQHKEDAQKSYEYASRAYKLEQQLGNAPKAAVRQAQMGGSLISLERWDEAKKALTQAIPTLREAGDLHSLGIACNHMGILLLTHEKQLPEASTYFNEALQIFHEQGDIYNECISRKGMYESLRFSDPTEAMIHNDWYNRLRDSLYDRETGELLSEYAAQYGHQQLLEEKEEMKHHYLLGIVVGVVVALMLALGTWLWSRRRERRQQQHTAELTRRIDELTQQFEQLNETQQKALADNDDQLLSEQDRIFLMQVIEAVNEGLPRRQYDVETIAAQLNMTAATFRRRLQAVACESPKNYISAIQMQKAAHLLTRHSELSVGEVADRCGFDEVGNFTRAFKRAYGVAPSQFREQQA